VPVEIKDLEEFVKITERALECRVKRSRREKGVVKIKARTKRYLYTYKTSEDKLNDVLSKVKCKKIIDVDEGKEIKAQASQ
jgi:large subunit ribosomal protein L38e